MRARVPAFPNSAAKVHYFFEIAATFAGKLTITFDERHRASQRACHRVPLMWCFSEKRTRDFGACRVGIGKERSKGCDNIFTRAKFNNNSLEKSVVNLLGFEENYLSLQLV